MRVLQIIVKPRCPRESIEVVSEDEMSISVKSTPERGRATKDALKLLARHLNVPFAKLMLTSNEGLQVKTVVVLD